MKLFSFSNIAVIVLIFSFSCSSTQSETSTRQPAGDSLPPVETKPRNHDFPPAFPGQTRVAGMATKTPVEGIVLSDKLSKPWAVTELPDGRLIITEKEGTLRIYSPQDGTLSEKITGLPAVNFAGQGGLLDIVPDTDFAGNRLLFWTYSEDQPGGTLTAVAKGNLSADETRVENVQVIYRATPAFPSRLHYGSRILIDKDNNLVFSTGERSELESRPQAQDLNSSLGKIIRITKDGAPAVGNPFLNDPNARDEFYSYGHRNVQGLVIHPATGDMWANEFGPRGGDELNLILPGKNYGWPVITYGIEYSGKTIGEVITQKEGMEQPVYYWDPVISPSGMMVYGSDVVPEWKNDIFMGCLSGQHIVRLKLENRRVVGEERLLDNLSERFRDVAGARDGYIYAVTDSGKLYRLGKKK